MKGRESTEKSDKNDIRRKAYSQKSYLSHTNSSMYWLIPSVYLIGRTIKHFCTLKTGAKAILVCPYCTSAIFWPLIVTKFNSLQKFVKDYFIINNARE